MKYLVLTLITAFSLTLNAQVKTGRTEFDKTTLDALQMDIDADYKIVADKWEDFWKDRYEVDFDKLDKDRSSIAMRTEQSSVPLISQKNADLFAKVAGMNDNSKLSFAVTFTANDVVTKTNHQKSFEAAEAILLEFRTYFYTEYFDEKLESARKDLDDIRDDSTDASKDAEKARSKIKKYEEKIAKYEEKIEKMREEVGDELETAEEKAARAKELEKKVRDLERMRAKYLG